MCVNHSLLPIAEHMDEYQECGRPYLFHHHLTPALTYVIMSPWMAEKFSWQISLSPTLPSECRWTYHTC